MGDALGYIDIRNLIITLAVLVFVAGSVRFVWRRYM